MSERTEKGYPNGSESTAPVDEPPPGVTLVDCPFHTSLGAIVGADLTYGEARARVLFAFEQAYVNGQLVRAEVLSLAKFHRPRTTLYREFTG